jgi:predicted transcriptional regulator
VNTVSIPKKELREYVIYNLELNKKDYKVFLMLLTELDGYSPPKNRSFTDSDPLNFTKVDSEQIAKQLDMDESDVKKSIKKLVKEGIIEKGDNHNTKNGYRFTF